MNALDRRSNCGVVRICWRSLVGLSFLLSTIAITSWGDITQILWSLVRVSGSIAIISVWIGVTYEFIECRNRYEWVPIIFAGILSLLLFFIYIFVSDIDSYSIESIRYFTFSALTHGLLLMLPLSRGYS